MSYYQPVVIVTLMLLVIIAENLKVTLPIALWSYFNNSNGLPELQMNLPSFMGYFNNSVFSAYKAAFVCNALAHVEKSCLVLVQSDAWSCWL